MKVEFYKLIENLNEDVLDLSNNMIFDLDIEKSNINKLILPRCCKRFNSMDSIIKIIVIGPYLDTINCSECGIEELIADYPMELLTTIYLDKNKLTKFNVQLLQKPIYIDISDNLISEIKYKIPYLHDLYIVENPITKEKNINEFIQY